MLGTTNPVPVTMDMDCEYGSPGSVNEIVAQTDVETESRDEEEINTESPYEQVGKHIFPPLIEDARAAFENIKRVLVPELKKGTHCEHHNLDELTHSCVQAMRKFLWKYIDKGDTKGWISALLETAHDHERGPHHARMLRNWTRTFIAVREIPTNPYGVWNVSMLEDEDLAQAIHLHLQSLGPYIRAQDVVDFMKKPEIAEQFNLKKGISLATAQWWMKQLGYRWTVTPTGQYVDGHENGCR
jgi:hypothetical protein